MIDNFALIVSHGMLLLVVWRLVKVGESHEGSPPRRNVKPRN